MDASSQKLQVHFGDFLQRLVTMESKQQGINDSRQRSKLHELKFELSSHSPTVPYKLGSQRLIFVRKSQKKDRTEKSCDQLMK